MADDVDAVVVEVERVDAAMPERTATSEPGTTGATRRSPSTSASEQRPTTSVRPWVSPSSVRTSQSCSKKLPSPFSMPNSFGTWPMMIVSARPTMKPLSTGSEMKLARKPSRSSPATSAASPVVMRQRGGQAANVVVARGATSATVAADSAAVADIGPDDEVPGAAERGVEDSAPGAA